jgi:hypothetical protein
LRKKREAKEAEKAAKAEGAAPAEGGEESESLEESKNINKKDIIKILLEVEVSGQDAETLGVDLWNASLNNKTVPKEFAQYENVFKELQKYSKKYKTEIKKYSGRRDSTTKFWLNQTGKSKDEPKTDLISLDEKKLRLSAKKGPAQLMSGVKEESRATIIAAAKKTGITKNVESKLMKLVDNLANSTRTDKLNTAQLRKTDLKNIKSDVNIKAKKILNAAIDANKELQTQLELLFNKNTEFKKAFVYEAMTGEQKFGDSSPAEANYVIAFSNDFMHVKVEDISKISSPIVSKIADKTKLNVSFKSTSYKIKGEKAGYNFFSTIRLGLEDLVSKQEKLDEIINSKQINELDIINSIEKFFKYISDKFNKIIDFVSNGIEKIKELIKEGFDKVLDFLGLQIDVDWNNEIDFYESI